MSSKYQEFQPYFNTFFFYFSVFFAKMSQIMSKILDCYRYSSDTNLLVLDFLPRWVISSVSCNAVPLRTGHNGNLLDDICISISHYLLDSSSTIPITWNFINCKSFYLWNSYVICINLYSSTKFMIKSLFLQKTVAMQYLNNATMMFLGGLILAIGVETSGLHRRIALKMVLVIGTSPRRIMLSCMLATAFLSMWISNTATTAMMLPIVEAVSDSLPRVNDHIRVLNDAGQFHYYDTSILTFY